MITTKLNFATALVATLISLTTHAQVSSVTSKHVVVRQTAEAQSCATVCALKEAFLGSPHAVGEMLKLGTAARAVHGTAIDGIPQFPRKSSWVGPNESDLIAEYNTFFQANIAAYATTVTTWQANNGLATASHDIIQKIEHRGKTKRAVVNLITFDNGNYYYNAVKIVADDPTAPAQVLYVRAIPSAPGPNLPAAFNWPTPGTLQYAMRSNFDFITSTGFTSVTVGPVYDEPFNYNNVAVNPDARLVCLFNRTSAGCGQSQPDVAGLIGTNDATFAIVDYYRVVKPVGQAYAGQFAGIVNGHVTNRAVNFTCDTDATGTYSQTFQYTQQLQFVIDRYTVYPDGKWYFTQRFREQKFPASINIPSTITVTRGSTALAGIVANTSFAHHRTNALTTATAYAPNTLPIDPVSVNMGGICAASCTIQPTQSESRLCPNDASRTYTATRTFDSNGCKYNDWTDDSSSACASSCPLSTQSESRFCPNDASRTYTATRTVDAANCTYNSWTDDSSSACASCTGRPASCPAGTSDGGWGCVVGATAQWSCLDGQTPTQAGFEYYVADTSAPGPGACPWKYNSQSLICPPPIQCTSTTTNNSGACGAGFTGTEYWTTTTWSSPSCGVTSESARDRSGCQPMPCSGRPDSCPSGTSDGGWGCVVGATAQWSCLDGQTPTQAGFEYYVADTSAPGPGACPWKYNSQSLICPCPKDSTSNQACPSPLTGTMTVSTTYNSSCTPSITDNRDSACNCPLNMDPDPITVCRPRLICPNPSNATKSCPSGYTGSYTETTTWSGNPCTASTSDDKATACVACNPGPQPPDEGGCPVLSAPDPYNGWFSGGTYVLSANGCSWERRTLLYCCGSAC